ncbi:MAG: hypothetical protein V4537_18130 [Pseudomonadota bacterium]
MSELAAILEGYKRTSGYRWSYIARLLGVQPETVWHWRRGHSLPYPGKVEQLATLVNRPDLMHVVERDRQLLARIGREATPVDAAHTNTPRTLIIPTDRGGAT